MDVIIIAGMPASGKSTVAGKLGKAFGYPVLEKDAIKEVLFDTIGFTNYGEKRRHDVAATAVLLRCTEDLLAGGSSLVCVNNFRPEVQPELEEILNRSGCRYVTVFFGGDADVFYKRYVERDEKHLRHLGHVLQDYYPPRPGDSLDYTMTRQEFAEKFEQLGMADFRLPGPRIEVDATFPEKIDVDELIAKIRESLGTERKEE